MDFCFAKSSSAWCLYYNCSRKKYTEHPFDTAFSNSTKWMHFIALTALEGGCGGLKIHLSCPRKLSMNPQGYHQVKDSNPCLSSSSLKSLCTFDIELWLGIRFEVLLVLTKIFQFSLILLSYQMKNLAVRTAFKSKGQERWSRPQPRPLASPTPCLGYHTCFRVSTKAILKNCLYLPAS